MADEKHCLIETETHNTHFKKYTVYLDKDIASPDKYRELFNILKTVCENDVIQFMFNCWGGRVDTKLQLLHALARTKAETIADVHVAKSAAVALFLACKEINVFEFSEVSIHNICRWYTDYTASMHKEINDWQHLKKIQDAMFNKYYYKLFTQEEIDSLKHGDVTIHIFGHEIKERLCNNEKT